MNLKNIFFLFGFYLISLSSYAQFNIGHATLSFFDSSRNRSIETEVYYPSVNDGDNVPIAIGEFPVLVFGHGFVMDWDAYQNFWDELVPEGYVICFPTTEMGFSPNHDDFGNDLNFVSTQMQIENGDNSSIFFNSLSSKSALMGHSMGGGASFLAAQNNSTVSTLVNFASAETTPSAILACSNISVPALIFSGEDDCVSPPNDNQDAMFNALASSCKTQITINNGGHCYFANDNFNCTFGESFCNSGLNITREEQQEVTFDFLKLWLTYTLYENTLAFTRFNDSLQASNRIDFDQVCDITSIMDPKEIMAFEVYPNPTSDKLNLKFLQEAKNGELAIFNSMGQRVYRNDLRIVDYPIALSHLKKGVYFVVLTVDSRIFSKTFLKIEGE